MNISKLLKKMRFAQFEEKTIPTQNIDTSTTNETPLVNNFPSQKNNIAPPSPISPAKKNIQLTSKLYIYDNGLTYVQLYPPSGFDIRNIQSFFNSLGYNYKNGNFSKCFFSNFKNDPNVTQDKIDKVKEDFNKIQQNNFDIMDPTDIFGQLNKRLTPNIEKVDYTVMSDKEKMEKLKESKGWVKKEMVEQQMRKVFYNINSPETKEFLNEKGRLHNIVAASFHKYTVSNSIIIALQNYKIDPITKKEIRNSGYVASSSNWGFMGRRPKEGERAMWIWYPSGFETLTYQDIVRFIDTTKRLFINLNQSIIESYERSSFLGKMKDKFSIICYNFVKNEITKKNPATIKDLITILEGKAFNAQKTKTVLDKKVSRFEFRALAWDMDQTEPIPGKEQFDIKPRIEKVRNMWLGMDNNPNEKVTVLTNTIESAIKNGKLTAKKIEVEILPTGSAGGYSTGGKIVIDENAKGMVALRTLIHETTHEFLHWTEETKGIDKKIAEYEADLTALIVLSYYKLDNQDGLQATTNYLHDIIEEMIKNNITGKYKNLTEEEKSKKIDELIVSGMENIFNASNAIINAIEEQKLEDEEKRTSTGGENLTQAKNWYERVKLAHYSEKEKPGEGYGGEGQFQARYIEDRARENEEWIKLMRAAIKEDLRTRSQDRTNRVMQRLLDIGYARQNIISWILGPAMHGIKVI